MSEHLRETPPPFVVAPPSGARVRTRLEVSDTDAAVLRALGTCLGSLASRDLAERCRQGRLDAKATAISRRERKRSLTAMSSSRWAGAITRASEDAFGLALRNLVAERRSLTARTARIRRRLSVPVGERRGRARGYATKDERFEKRRRLQALEHRLVEVEARIGEGRVSICRGGKALARARHHLADAGLAEDEWRGRWQAERWFLTADGEKDQLFGNLTIRWHPDEHWLEVALPTALAHLANRPHARYRLSCPVAFSYRGEEVATQATTGAVRYDITFIPEKGRCYLDASWRIPAPATPTLDQLRKDRVLAVDVNAAHLAAMVVDPSGNPVGAPLTVPLALAGLAATTRDGHLRQAICQLLATARVSGCRAVVIEDLDFAEARELGREHSGRRPSVAGGGGTSVAWSQGSRRRGSAPGWSRWRPTSASRSSPSTRPTPAGGEPSTGSTPSRRSLTMPRATMRRPSSSADAGSGSEHGEGRGVTRPSSAWGRESYPSGRAVHGCRATGVPARAANEEHRDPRGQRADAPAAEDPKG